jgi:ribosomal protein S18 acetylase RimI-like enzyme
MITGRWGKPNQVLLDIIVDDQGNVTGIANPGRENAPITLGKFDAGTSTLRLEGAHAEEGQRPVPFLIEGRLDGRTLHLTYQFGGVRGEVQLVRVEEYVPAPLSLIQRIKPHIEDFQRWINSLTRPRGDDNRRKLQERGEALDSIVFREATVADIPALAELHVTTWNATYNTSNGPTVATRAWQWTGHLAKPFRKDFILILEDRNGRLIGFAWGKPGDGEWKGNLSKIYLRWEYHGLGLGRRMMGHIARRFLDRGVDSFILFAERSNPTIGFYDRLGGERLLDEHGRFAGAYGWRDVRKLADECPVDGAPD